MSFFSGISRFERRIEDTENRRIFEKLEGYFRDLIFHFEDEATPAGWIHDFFCDDCLTPLRYESGKVFCERCGKDYTHDPRKVRASVMDRRYRISEALVFASFMANLGFEEWKEGIEKILDFYTENLSEFNPSSRISGESPKLTSQLLNDAMVILNFSTALMNTDFPKEKMDFWKEGLFDPVVESLKAKEFEVHNHNVWISSAIAMKSLVFDEGDLDEWVEDLEEMARRGFLKNGFWYEGSFHYHFYTVNGFLRFYLPYISTKGRRSEILDEELRRAILAPTAFLFPDGRFPNPGDGWPEIGLNTYSDVLEYGAEVFKDKDVLSVLCRARGGKGRDLPVYGKGVSEGIYPERFYFSNECDLDRSPGFPSIAYGPGESVFVRRGEWNVFLKAGQSSSSHIHEDLCNFEVYMNDIPVTVDLSNSGYGLRERRKWFSKGLAHNTFFVNGEAFRFSGMESIVEWDGSVGCILKKNSFGFEFSRRVEIGEDLVVRSELEKAGARVGMSFIFPHENDLKGSSIGPNVEASDEVDWNLKTSGSLRIDFQRFLVDLSADGADIFVGRGYWIPRSRRVTVVYVEADDLLKVDLRISGR